jgi:hypothetical protein
VDVLHRGEHAQADRSVLTTLLVYYILAVCCTLHKVKTIDIHSNSSAERFFQRAPLKHFLAYLFGYGLTAMLAMRAPQTARNQCNAQNSRMRLVRYSKYSTTTFMHNLQLFIMKLPVETDYRSQVQHLTESAASAPISANTS